MTRYIFLISAVDFKNYLGFLLPSLHLSGVFFNSIFFQFRIECLFIILLFFLKQQTKQTKNRLNFKQIDVQGG